jgi:hypothetical protein
MSLQNPPYGWRLFSREERKYQDQEAFRERWVHDESVSGITFLSYAEAGRVNYVVEGYGIGTVDPATFRETVEQAPIVRSEHEDFAAATEALRQLMVETYLRWQRRST